MGYHCSLVVDIFARYKPVPVPGNFGDPHPQVRVCPGVGTGTVKYTHGLPMLFTTYRSAILIYVLHALSSGSHIRKKIIYWLQVLLDLL